MDQSLKAVAIKSDFSEHKRNLTILHFDGLYETHAFDLSGHAQAELSRALTVLKPYNKKVRIVFIGHADSSRFTKESDHLGNNFDLIAVRASRVVAYGVSMSFDISYHSVAAERSNLRNPRILSL